MLDEYCRTLSDEAQLRIALRFANAALPIWESYHQAAPVAIIKVNELIGEQNRITNASTSIDIGFLKRTLDKIQRSLDAANSQRGQRPLPQMKGDPTLLPALLTIMQPVTNPEWDGLLPQSVKLVYTSAFNILTWILKRRRTPGNETHIYVAINQSADALMRESVMTVEQIQKVLDEYQSQQRSPEEESEWENAFSVGNNEPMDQEDIYERIIGKKVSKDQCGQTLGKEVLRQMREENKSFWDEWEEYQTGTSITYSYDNEAKTFKRHEFDVIVGSFSNHIHMTEGEMLDFVSGLQLADLRTSGFEV
jgi:hypothetical protein